MKTLIQISYTKLCRTCYYKWGSSLALGAPFVMCDQMNGDPKHVAC